MKQNIFQKYLTSRVLPIWTILLFDVFIVTLSTILAYALRVDFKSAFLDAQILTSTIIISILVNVVFFRIFKTYSGVLRYSSFVDILRIFASLAAAYAVLIILSFILSACGLTILLSPFVLMIAMVFSSALMVCSRVVVKTLFEFLNFDVLFCKITIVIINLTSQSSHIY